MKLTDVCDFQGGSQPPKEEWSYEKQDGFIRMLQIRDFTQREKVTPEYIKLSNNTKICEADDILIARYGASIGKILTGLAGAYNVAIMRTIPDETILKKRYLYYYLKSSYFQNNILNVGSRAAQAGFNKEDLSKLSIHCPKIEEQDDIVYILEIVEKIIAERERELKLLDELIKARFVELFGAINDDVPLSYYIASLNAGKSLAGEEECPNKVLKTGAATYDYFDATQVKNLPLDYEPQEDHRVSAGDVIISRMNTAELVGAAAYVWDVPERVYLPDRLWRAEIKDTANAIFVWQVLIQSSTKESIRRIASGTSGSMKNISKLGLLGIRVVKAPISLQEQFATFVEQTDKSKFVEQNINEKIQFLFNSLMKKIG